MGNNTKIASADDVIRQGNQINFLNMFSQKHNLNNVFDCWQQFLGNCVKFLGSW